MFVLVFTTRRGVTQNLQARQFVLCLKTINPPPPSIIIHILHDNTLTPDNRDKLTYLAALKYEQIIMFHNVEELCADKIAKIRELIPEVDKIRLSIGAFYRFFIPYVLPAEVEKAIYCDADIIVNLDLKELWQIELGDKPFGAIPNLFQFADEKVFVERTEKFIKLCKDGFVKPEDYFNSGVLLLNLKFMRDAEQTLISEMEFLNEHNQLQYLDQDILNYCFSTSYLKLPERFNRFVIRARPENEWTIEQKIYHYAGGKWSLGIDLNDPFNRLWWSYFVKTPFFGLNTIETLLKGAQDSMLQPVDKHRAFVVDEEHAHLIEKNFSVRDDEKVFIVNPTDAENLNRIIDIMTAERGKKIFFVAISNIIPALQPAGFVEYRDFFNVSTFYSPAWLNRENNYKLILSM